MDTTTTTAANTTTSSNDCNGNTGKDARRQQFTNKQRMDMYAFCVLELEMHSHKVSIKKKTQALQKALEEHKGGKHEDLIVDNNHHLNQTINDHGQLQQQRITELPLHLQLLNPLNEQPTDTPAAIVEKHNLQQQQLQQQQQQQQLQQQQQGCLSAASTDLPLLNASIQANPLISTQTPAPPISVNHMDQTGTSGAATMMVNIELHPNGETGEICNQNNGSISIMQANKTLLELEQEVESTQRTCYSDFQKTQVLTSSMLREVQKRFAKYYPNSAIPSRTTIKHVFNKCISHGSVENIKTPRKAVKIPQGDEIEHLLIHEPQLSLRQMAQKLNVSTGTVSRRCRALGLVPESVTIKHQQLATARRQKQIKQNRLSS